MNIDWCNMNQNRRIILNVLATYGRSLYALILGLFAGRWALMALGTIDYGLLGVVGGLTVFISFFNTILASSVSRFYAYSVGATQKACSYEAGLDECRRWFNTALFIHTIIPTILIIIGYPIGVWAIKSFLSIPLERIGVCVGVFRFVCISCFIGMINIPFSAMYTAKQYIAELTVYGVVSSTVNVIFLYYMVTNPGDWLLKYAAWKCFVAILPQIIIMLRAIIIFPECRFRIKFLFDGIRLIQLFKFAFWQMFGALGWMLNEQGMSILINKYFGPEYNASRTVSSTINGQANSLTSAMVGAFVPAITQACGANNRDEMISMAYRADKFGLALSLIFFLPLSIELKEVVNLWLKNPPPATVGLCMLAMVGILMNNSSIGFMSAIMANGKIALYQITLGSVLIFVLPVAWLCCHCCFSIYVVTSIATIAFCIHSFLRVVFARYLLNISILMWFSKVVIPCIVTILMSLIVGLCSVYFIKPSFIRVIFTTILVEITFLPMLWFVILDDIERRVVSSKIAILIKGRNNE